MAKTKEPKEKAKASKPRTRRQGQIPGTEPVEIEKLTDASEAYQKKIRERMAVAKEEADQKAHLNNIVSMLIEKGRLKLNPAVPDGVKQPVYSYFDDEGNKRIVNAVKDPLKISVHVEKSKDE